MSKYCLLITPMQWGIFHYSFNNLVIYSIFLQNQKIEIHTQISKLVINTYILIMFLKSLITQKRNNNALFEAEMSTINAW